jgi:arabinose-5-phosphate isomerase
VTALEIGRRTLVLEGSAVLAAADRLGDEFGHAVELLAGAGRIVVTGIGKSGVIAQKIAATFTSTGTPATWLHPVDSLHGDLGLVSRDTVAVILSKSGETEELFGLVAALARREVPIIAITGERDSALGRASRAVLDAAVAEEACPHGLAPTTSTTVALALGDALAVALLERKGFGRDDFAALHPGGRLGRKLLLRVADVMVNPGQLLSPKASMRDVVVALAHGRGIAPIVDDGQLVGVITAGDLTRLVERTPDFTGALAGEVMNTLPRTVPGDSLAATAVGLMERSSIIALPVVDDSGTVIGVVHLHDLMRAGAA